LRAPRDQAGSAARTRALDGPSSPENILAPVHRAVLASPAESPAPAPRSAEGADPAPPSSAAAPAPTKAAQKPASLHIVTLHEGRGTWARVYIDDRLVNESHATYEKLPAGHYRVAVRREGFRDVRRELTLSPGQEHKVVLVLEKE
jgi:hypothetical protein